ncbi:MAG: NHL repeat-containing protein, partial [Spirochaetaceae bacterium]|nr:NHL repeat-containing protein [Spirochaetaceae bacterium]
MIRKRISLSAFFLLIIGNVSLFSQSIDMKAVEAEENLRWGVIAYNNGYYNKSVQSLEKSLALKPENSRILMWLGRSYYMSGMEDAALAEWDKIINSEKAGSSLINFSELVKYRQLLSIRPEFEEKWVIHMDIENMSGSYELFQRPTATSSSLDGSGSIYVVSFATNEVLRFNANGALKSVFDGGLEGYNHPFDIYPLKNGNYLLSEFSGNNVSLCNSEGQRIVKIGQKGISPGQLLGPQFLASDNSNYFYVTDAGNRKVVKYDFEGNFILEMGRRTPDYDGLSGPAGIALLHNELYVVDSIKKAIDVFDESGNYLRTQIEGKLEMPEGLSVYKDDLLIADGALVRRYNPAMDLLTVFADRRGNSSRAINIDFDENGNLLIADYDTNR